MNIGDTVTFDHGSPAFEAVVTGAEYYDSEWSVRRLPVRVTRIIRDVTAQERAQKWDEKERLLQVGLTFHGAPAESYRSGRY